MRDSDYELISGNLVEAPAAPGQIQILPWGAFEVHGRTYHYTEESVPLIAERIAAHGVDLPVDYDHGTSTNPPATGIAPAAGWIKRIEAAAGQPLRGQVEWTPAGARHVSAREFRYLSPTFYARPADGLVIGLHSVALTNKPAIAHMPPIAAHRPGAGATPNPASPGERTEAMKQIIACLGLAGEATEEQCVAKLKELQASAAEAAGLRQAIVAAAAELGDETLKAQAASEKVEVVSASLQTAALKARNPAGKVDAAEYDALKVRIGQLESDLRTRECNALIAAHATKLAPAKHEWFRKFYASDPKAAQEWLNEAPELVSSHRLDPAPPAGGGTGREARIGELQAEFKAGEGKPRLCTSARDYVSGGLIAAGLPALTKEEAEKHGLVS